MITLYNFAMKIGEKAALKRDPKSYPTCSFYLLCCNQSLPTEKTHFLKFQKQNIQRVFVFVSFTLFKLLIFLPTNSRPLSLSLSFI